MNAPQVGTGFTSSPNAPDYIDLNSPDLKQENTNNRVQQGSTLNRGVILTKDSLDVSLEFAFGITNEHSESSRPSLSPLFRTRFVEDQSTEDLSANYYQELRNALPPNLQNQLTADEQQAFEDRDPDLIALDKSLRFDATILTMMNQTSTPVAEDDVKLAVAQNYLDLPDAIKKEILTFSDHIHHYLTEHLKKIGPNDPSFDLFLNASHHIGQAMQVLQWINQRSGGQQ